MHVRDENGCCSSKQRASLGELVPIRARARGPADDGARRALRGQRQAAAHPIAPCACWRAPALAMSEEDARVERYLLEHRIEAVLADAVLDAVLCGAPSPLRHIAAYLTRITDGLSPAVEMASSAPRRLLRTATWNIAAINNNPFEFWITHDDPEYQALMTGVQSFISAPGEQDVPVSEVFPAHRFEALRSLMSAQGWSGLDQLDAFWRDDLSARPIVSGFMKDKSLGDKRLASMPDRVTNAIDTADGGRVFRPSVISCYAGDLSSQQVWWEAWTAFMFRTPLSLPAKAVGGPLVQAVPAALLGPIQRSKYPAVTEEEEAISIPLQTLCAAVFDAILVRECELEEAQGRGRGTPPPLRRQYRECE